MKLRCLHFICVLALAASNAHGDTGSDILAYVGKQQITRADVDFLLGRVPDARTPKAKTPKTETPNTNTPGANPGPLPRLTVQTAVRLISLQRQALQTMRKLDVATNAEEVEQWIQDNNNPSGEPTTTRNLIAATIERFDIQERSYVDVVAFRLSWRRYLAKHLTKANIAKHYRNQTARFDGTRFKIWMVSVIAPAGQSQQRRDTSEALASLAQRIEKDTVDIANLPDEASKQGWSFTPETWVPGTGQLDPTVIDAILKLEEQAVSPPVHTAGGVHLIQLTETDPGSLELAQVQDEVRAHMLIFLLEHLAALSRDQLPLNSATNELR